MTLNHVLYKAFHKQVFGRSKEGLKVVVTTTEDGDLR